MIDTTQVFHSGHEQGDIVIRALSSITSEQVDAIGHIVRASMQPWDFQMMTDYDGYVSILIEPSTVSDEQRAFFISGTAQHLELAETQGDSLASIVTFSTIDAIELRLTELLRSQ